MRVETLAHNEFLTYTPTGAGPRGVERVTLRGQSAELFIEVGRWFFHPAGTIARHFSPAEPFSLVYVHHPYLGIFDPPTP